MKARTVIFNLCISSACDSVQLTHSRISFCVYQIELKCKAKKSICQAILSPGLEEFLFSHDFELIYHPDAFSLNDFYLSSLSSYAVPRIKQNIADLFSQVQSIVNWQPHQPKDYSSNNQAQN